MFWRIFPSLAQEMLLSFQTRLFESLLSDPHLLLTQNIDANSLDAQDISYNRFLSSFRSNAIMPFVTEWNQVPVGRRDTKMTLLKQLASSLTNLNQHSIMELLDSDSDDWKLAVDLFVHTIACYRSTFDENDASSIISLLSLLRSSLHSVLDGSNNNSSSLFTSNDCERLCNIISNTKDEMLSNCNSLVTSILNVLLKRIQLTPEQDEKQGMNLTPHPQFPVLIYFYSCRWTINRIERPTNILTWSIAPSTPASSR